MTKAEEYNKIGMEYFSKREYRKASEYFIKASRLQEKSSLYLYNAGNALCRDALEGRKESCAPARAYLEKAAGLFNADACYILGNTYNPAVYKVFEPKDMKTALDYYLKTVEYRAQSSRNLASALNNLGCIYGGANDFKRAALYTWLAWKKNSSAARENYKTYSSLLEPGQIRIIESAVDAGDIPMTLKNLGAGPAPDLGPDLPGQAGQPVTGGPSSQTPVKEEPRKSLEELMDELNSLVGLENVKKEVNSLVNLMRVSRMRKERGMKATPVSLHLVFTGNPGTGKTTVARLLAGLYREIGVLSRGQLVEVDRSGLVAGYIGQTAIKTQEKVREALGGILFIDEAYTLVKEGNDFGQEAIDTILKAMEDNREDFLIIVAGYPEQMDQFLDSNPGLRSRFNKIIEFEDYDGEELTDIFRLLCKNSGYTLTAATRKYVSEYFEDYYQKTRDQETSDNGRAVRNFFEKAVVNQANRLASKKTISDKELMVLKLQDVRMEEPDQDEE